MQNDHEFGVDAPHDFGDTPNTDEEFNKAVNEVVTERHSISEDIQNDNLTIASDNDFHVEEPEKLDEDIVNSENLTDSNDLESLEQDINAPHNFGETPNTYEDFTRTSQNTFVEGHVTVIASDDFVEDNYSMLATSDFSIPESEKLAQDIVNSDNTTGTTISDNLTVHGLAPQIDHTLIESSLEEQASSHDTNLTDTNEAEINQDGISLTQEFSRSR